MQRPPGVGGGPPQHLGVVAALGVQGAGDDGPVLGEGAGLVEAEHVDGAEVVQGGQPGDDDPVLAGEARGAARQGGGHHHGQHLGGEPDRDGHRERQRLQAAPVQRRPGDQHQRRGEQHEADQRPGDAVHRPVEGGKPPPVARPVGGGEPGARAGRGDQRGGAAVGDAAALEAEVRRRERAGRRRPRLLHGVLRHRRRLPGQRLLMDAEPGRPQQPYVGGDQVAGPQPDHVTGDHLADRDLPRPGRDLVTGPADHGGGGREQGAQQADGAVRPVFAGDPQDAADQYQGADHGGRAPGGDDGGEHAEAEQHGGEGVPQAAQQAAAPGDPAPRRQRVLAVPGEPPGRLLLGEAARAAAVGAQQLERGEPGGVRRGGARGRAAGVVRVRPPGRRPPAQPPAPRRRPGRPASAASCSASRPTIDWTTVTTSGSSTK